MNRKLLSDIVSFVTFLLLHVVFFRHAVFMHAAFCFFYLIFFLRLQVDVNPLPAMLSAFAMGLLVDQFYDSMGLHAMATVLMVYLRKHWLLLLTPQGGFDAGARPSLFQSGTMWYVLYAFPLIFIHHAVLFFTEAGGFQYFWTTLARVMASSVYTLLMAMLLEWLRPPKRI